MLVLGYNKSFSEKELFEIMNGEHALDSNSDSPALYVGTYGKYNDGNLFGMWVDLSTFSDYDEFIDFCRELHKDEADPEFMFQDYQGFPKSWYSECIDEETFDKILEYAGKDDSEREIWETYLDNVDGKASFEDAQDRYCGQYDTEEDFAEEIISDCYPDLPEFALRYFDYAAYARDIFIDSFYWLNGFVFHQY